MQDERKTKKQLIRELRGLRRQIARPSRSTEQLEAEVAEHRQTVEEPKLIEAQLLQAHKMEAVGQLAGGIAHDFKNVINTIMGYCTLARMKMEKEDPTREYMEEVLSAARRASDLTKRLLTFSRKQNVDKKPVDLNRTIRAMGKLLLKIIGEDITLSMELHAQAAVVIADSGQIGQVIMNLAANARDAMPEGGVLTIRTQLKKIDDAFKRRRGYGEPGDYVLITVEDTGRGMDEETSKKIFEPFFTTKKADRGTGLGLSITYGIVKQHHGYIDVTSAPGTGTVFRVYLPATKLSVEEPAEPDLTTMVSGKETILLAEDEMMLRKATKTMLERFGYTVITAKDGASAVRTFRKHRQAIQLVVLDVIMPKKNGVEAYHEIQALRPDVQTIFLSGYTNDIVKKKILDQGCTLVLKPFLPRELCGVIRKVLDTKRPDADCACPSPASPVEGVS